MLRAVRKDCFTYAQQLGDYQSMTENEIMDGYCDARDSGAKDAEQRYLAAEILRKWYTIHQKILPKGKLYGIEDESDAFAILVEAIQYADKYRAWRNPEKKCNAQQAVNMCITTICEQHRYQATLDKHQANYNSSSLDAPVRGKDGSDEAATVGDTIAAEDIESPILDGSAAAAMIQECINRKRPVEAIFLDIMANNDTLKHTKKTVKIQDPDGKARRATQYYSEGWDYKTIQLTGELDYDTYLHYFLKKYKITEEIARAALDVVFRANNQKKYRYLRKTKEYSKKLAVEFLLN